MLARRLISELESGARELLFHHRFHIDGIHTRQNKDLANPPDPTAFGGERMGETRLVPLRDELDLISKYLSVEKVRLGDKFEIRTEIDAETENALVPTLLLQPLVENAVRHGLATRAAGGELIVAAQLVDGYLRMEVRDTGAGAPGLELDSLMDRGTGLRNISARLRVLYGDAGRLEATSPREGGFRVVVTLPAGDSA